MPRLRFLLLEDSLLDAELIETTLSEGEIACEIVQVQSGSDFQRALATHSFDLILSDYSLPSFDGISALKIAQDCCPDVPFIFVSGALGEELAIETLKSGATDYVLKQRLQRLVPSVQRALREAQERRDRKQAEVALRESEARFQAFMSHSPAAAWISDREGRLLYLSPTYFRLFQFPQQDAVGKRIDEIYPQEFAQQFLDNNQQVFETQQGMETIESAPRIDGSIGDFLVYKFPIPQTSQAMLLGGVAVDITERKRHEETIRSLLRISEKLNSTLDIDVLLDSLVTEAIALVNAQSGCSGLYTPQGMVCHKYFNNGKILPLEYVWSPGEGLPGWLILHKVPYLTNDALNDPQIVQELCQHFAVHSAISTPLLNAYGEIIGFFEIHNKKEGVGFTSSDQEKLVAVSQIAASAIQNALSYRRIQQAKEGLRQSERLYRAIGETIDYGIWVCDPQGRNLYASESFLRLVGLTQEQCSAFGWKEVLHPDDAESTIAAWQECVRRGDFWDIEHRFRGVDGNWHPVLARGVPVRDEKGEILCWAGINLDISRLKQAEAELRQSEERYRYLAESIPQLIWTATAEGTLLDVNQRWLDYTGMTLTQAQSDGWQPIVYPEDVPILSQSWTAAQKTGTYYQAEGRMRRADGVYRWHLHQAVPLLDELGKVLKWFGTATDVEERKQLEQQRDRLLTQERSARESAEAANRIKDEFLAVLSHELRSPLNPILGWAKLLQRGNLDESTAQRALETIERNAKLQTQLIEDLLDISRILRGKIVLKASPVDLVSVIYSAKETVQLAAEAKGIDWVFEHPPTAENASWQVMGDATRLQQIVWNLLSNAIKFTSTGGRVEVRLESYEFSVLSSPLEDSTQNFQSYAQITITDTGKGITPDFLPYVFDYFRQEDSTTTRRFGGLGLGLAIVRYLTELHGGTVTVESLGEGLGTTFKVQLPLLKCQIPAISSENKLISPPIPDTQLAGVRILVVDDEADMRELLQAILEQAQVQVRSAASVQEALLMFASFQPDVLISDIGMPGVDGYQLMRQIRALPPENGGQIRAIALSAYAGEYDRKQALAAGFQQHIPKPVEPNSLIQMIVTLLGRKP